MERHFDQQLDELKKTILLMGGHVEKAIHEAVQALVKRDVLRFSRVAELEEEIDRLHLRVDQDCFELLAQNSPVAKDLRLILSIIKINTDLERMGDQSVNIAHTGRHFLSEGSMHLNQDISEMADKVREMVKNSLDSFVRADLALAKSVLDSDDEVDRAKNSVFKTQTEYIAENPSQVEVSMDMILIARSLERLGDHATNIAEDVIFAFTGKDVRHGVDKGENREPV